ncbi:hypothetical protein CAPTEDRAFT_225379 [Capitella teleta]|uniref:Proline-rich protein PRCC n=1 Tax=Capitella teleta TaxID=283909 RepID=R7U765_CAPTE|nr:hypothetical protein CAPTEDRAFT_225379 [Capitella teleta]|eukprot:ELT98980.1 hypothetical protein CAPTEDRAFT_225379 [Capitella teleta]
MSLVAYASSGESDSEDEVSSTSQIPVKPSVSSTVKSPPHRTVTVDSGATGSAGIERDAPISDEEDANIFQKTSSGLRLPPPRSQGSPANGSTTSIEASSGHHLLSGLPAPRTILTVSTVQEDELEDIVKPKAAELALQEKPPPPKKRKKAVRISIPSLLPQHDSDEEDDRPTVHPKPSHSPVRLLKITLPTNTALSDGVSSSSESFADNPLQINEISKPFGPMRPEARQPLSDAEVYPEYSQIEDDVLPDSSSYPEAEDVGALQHDQQFLRMQGKGNRAEVVDFIDFNVDDHTDKKEDLKYLTVEKSEMTTKEEEKQFTTEQKKKHQIQYLAFMAKKREVDLKNQWAAQRASKRQTQAKYGF